MPATLSHTSRAHGGVLLTTAGAAALLAWVVGVGSALAPMPAYTTAPLSGSYGATAAAVGVTPQAYRVYKWPNTYTPGPTAPAGTPCANSELPPDAIACMEIEVLGSNRRCSRGRKITIMPTPLTAAANLHNIRSQSADHPVNVG
jgi:hypothetical protein